jgi:hypothetical protein
MRARPPGIQFTQAFLLITDSLPAKQMIAKGLAPHISLVRVRGPCGARAGMETFLPHSRGPCPGKVLDFGAKPEYGTLAAYLARAIRNL